MTPGLTSAIAETASPATVPLGAVGLTESLDVLAEQASDFVEAMRGDADGVELWIERRTRWGHLITPDGRQPDSRDVIRFSVRLWQGDQLGGAHGLGADADSWKRALTAARKGMHPTDIPCPPRPAVRRPGPTVFDPDLPDALRGRRVLDRLADALMTNAEHENERLPGLTTLRGRLGFEAVQRIVSNQAGTVAALQGALSAEIELNDAYGERYQVIHLPESFLPIALMGARTWRTMPRARVAPEAGLKAPMAVVLHPRVIEQLVREGLPHVLSTPADGPLHYGHHDSVAHDSLTLIDDPGLDGLAMSRAFDDEGRPTQRTALLVRGRVAQRLCSRRAAQRRGLVGTGSARRVDGPWGAAHAVAPRTAFGSLLMERGDIGFHDMIAAPDRVVLVHALDGLRMNPVTTQFDARVRWGVLLGETPDGAVLSPGLWGISGRLLGDDGLLSAVTLSREMQDTGTAIMPYCMAELTVERR